jgi:hypothetical protein
MGWFVLSAGVVVLVGAAFAQQGRMHHGEGGQPETPAHMGMMVAGDVAAHEGTIYLVRGGELQKLNRRLEVVESVYLPAPEQAAGMMQRGMMGGGMMGGGPGGRGIMHGAMAREHGPGPGAILMMAQHLGLIDRQKGRIEEIARRAHRDAQGVLTEEQREELEEMWSVGEEGEEPARVGRGMMGEGMHGDIMGHMASVAADERGVYLIVGGRLIAYDHALNKRRTKELYEAEEGADQQPRRMRGRMHRR